MEPHGLTANTKKMICGDSGCLNPALVDNDKDAVYKHIPLFKDANIILVNCMSYR